MLRQLTLFLLLIGALLSARAETVEVDGITYSLDTSNYTASITKGYASGELTLPETISYGGNSYTVTAIVTEAFQGIQELTKITFPTSITNIGNSAFADCRSLREVIMPQACLTLGAYAFSSCSSLKNVTMNEVKSIGYCAFTGVKGAIINFSGNVPPTINTYESLGSGNVVIVPDKAKTEYERIFSAEEVLLFANNEIPQTDETKTNYVIEVSLMDKASGFQKALILDNGLEAKSYVNSLKILGPINQYDFEVIRGLSNLVNLDLSETVIDGNTIGNDALENMTKLESIELPTSVRKIGNGAFQGCTALRNVGDLPSLISLDSYAFDGCTSLQNIGNMPSLTTIGSAAFQRCSALLSIGDLPSLISLGGHAFNGCSSMCSIGDLPSLTSIGDDAFQSCRSLQSISDLPSLTSIGKESFNYCNNLKSIGNMPKLTNIGSRAFGSCSKLRTIGDLPELSVIGSYAFFSCSALNSIGDLSNLKVIGENAFNSTPVSDLYLPVTLENAATSAFTAPTIVHFAGSTPPTFSGTSISTTICVPQGSVEAYTEALPDMPIAKIAIEGLTVYDVAVSALENDSDVLNKINEGYSNDMTPNVLDLKVSGTINSYDIIAFRNKMLNLRKLDLSGAIITSSSYDYYAGCHTTENVVGKNMFQDLNIREIILPQNVTSIESSAFSNCRYLISIVLSDSINSIGDYAFSGCAKLAEIIYPKSLTFIGSRAFQNCHSLQEVNLPPSIENVPFSCFNGCTKLSKVSLPPTLKTIESSAFNGCSALKEFRIPAGITKIGDNAIPSSVTDVYTYTIQPTSIGQSTFGSATYLNATLHVPETSEKLYYWDTQWSQFQNIVNFNEPYTYFYLDDKDLVEDPDTPRIDGETDKETGDKKNPDADLGQGSGLIVDGDKSQDLGNVDLEHDGKGDGASIIGGDSNTSESGGNVNIDMLNIKIPVIGKKWYFFAFPFDIELKNIKCDGQMVWRYYDGEWRAMHGSGSWKDVTGDKLERGRGYIFQGSKSGILTLSIPKAHFDGKDWLHRLKQYVSEFAQDASWNFIGNPFQSYYELGDLGFDGPITWWNPDNNSYEAYSPLDDDFSMYPYMGFFVQKPEGTDDVEFYGRRRETRNQKNDPNHRSAARARRAARRSPATNERQLVNLTVTDGTHADRTRVVFNKQASDAYEVGVDASKFVSADAPQIYSIDSRNVRYAINERPAGDGIVKLGFYAPATGIFTIECKRNDCPVTLKDCETGMVVTLTPGQTYQFNAQKGYDDSRFVLNAEPEGVSSVESVNAADEQPDATYYRVNGVKDDGSHSGLMIEVKGNEATKVIRK